MNFKVLFYIILFEWNTASGDYGGTEGITALPGMHREDTQDSVQDQWWV